MGCDAQLAAHLCIYVSIFCDDLDLSQNDLLVC